MDFKEFNRQMEEYVKGILTPEQIRQVQEEENRQVSISLNQHIDTIRQGVDFLFAQSQKKSEVPLVIQPLVDKLIQIQKTLPIDGTGYYQTAGHYGEYFAMHQKDAEQMKSFLDELKLTVADSVDAVTDDNEEDADPFLYLLHKIVHRMNDGLAKSALPTMCLVSGHIFGEGINLPRPIEGWYQDTMINLGVAQQYLDEYLQILFERTAEDDELIEGFLCDLDHDMTSFNAACVNLATIAAIHAQKEDCAVYVGTTPYSLPRHSRQAVQKRMDALLQFPVYAKYNSEHGATAGIKGDIVNIPTYVSVIDIEEFVKYWRVFWQRAVDSALSAPKSKEFKVKHFCRPLATAEKQARISWDFSMGSKDFNLRIDRETHPHNQLSIDIGKADLDDAFNYAEEVGQHSLQQEVVMGYSAILDGKGSHAHLLNPQNPFPRHQEFYYPSIMNSSRITNLNQRMAIVASVVLTQAQELDLFDQDRTFSNHCRGGYLDHPDNWDNFDIIAQKFQSLILRR